MRTRQLTSPARVVGVTLMVLAALAFSGCGGGAPSQPAGSIKVTMTEFKFDPSSIDAKAGKVTLYLVNSGTTAHDLVVKDSSGGVVAKSKMVQSGDTTTLDIPNLPAGSYTILCDVPGHAESGMKGTLDAR